jgi:ADP-ribosyl-[dinitrogen reductase] hydrolase
MPGIGSHDEWSRHFEGVLAGTAVGDALGLPAEGLSRARIRARWAGDWRMRLVAGRGMVSDDTDHALMVAESLLAEPSDPDRFQRELARRLRWWFAALPAGVGLGTARACLKLWLGVPPSKSGTGSAGAGPAMRSAVIGVFFADEPENRRRCVAASTSMTHRSWESLAAAEAVADAAALAVHSGGPPELGAVMNVLATVSEHAQWRDVLRTMLAALERGDSTSDYASSLGLERGASGFALHVVPLALHAWLRHGGDYEPAVCAALDCGGDTDTVGAVTGALCGVVGGPRSIPDRWRTRLWDWPDPLRRIAGLSAALGGLRCGLTAPQTMQRIRLPTLVRNSAFLAVVLAHGFRRLAPPFG